MITTNQRAQTTVNLIDGRPARTVSRNPAPIVQTRTRFQTRLSQLIASIALFALAGCASPYLPPATGPTAKLDVALAIGQGNGSLSFDRSPGLLTTDFDNRATILNGNAHKQSQTTVSIPADQNDVFIYLGFLRGGTCKIPFILLTKSGQTYLILAGNEPPRPYTGSFFDRVGEAFIRGNGVCYVHAFVRGPQGNFLPYKLKHG